MTNADIHFLHHALRLAERGLGRTMPNPSVGCVLVKDGRVLAATRTDDGGRPHAEALALAQAGDAARGATVYVTLEPCAHHGKTPPCAEALIAARVARVVIGCEDPDPRVSGKGVTMLREAGIEVVLMPTAAAYAVNRGFFQRVQQGLPYVAMKLATSRDLFMARSDGGGQWITGETARRHGNGLRGQFDAMLTGIGTVLADDPALSVRAPHAPHPALIRVVCDRQLRVPLRCQLVRTARMQPTWVITSAQAVEQQASHATELREAGVILHAVEEVALRPQTVLKTLAAEGVTRLLIEAGPTLSGSFLRDGAVQTLHWYKAPFSLGNAGKSAVDALDSSLAGSAHTLGDDTYERIELQ